MGPYTHVVLLKYPELSYEVIRKTGEGLRLKGFAWPVPESEVRFVLPPGYEIKPDDAAH